MCTIGVVFGNLLCSYGFVETYVGKMSKGRSGSYFESSSRRSSWGSTWRERRQKRCEDREHEQEEEQSNLGEGLYQTHWTKSGALGRGHFDTRDEELECLHRLVRDLELEERGRRRRRDHDNHEEGSVNVGGHYGAKSYQFGSHQHRDHSHSHEYADRDLDSPEER